MTISPIACDRDEQHVTYSTLTITDEPFLNRVPFRRKFLGDPVRGGARGIMDGSRWPGLSGPKTPSSTDDDERQVHDMPKYPPPPEDAAGCGSVSGHGTPGSHLGGMLLDVVYVDGSLARTKWCLLSEVHRPGATVPGHR
jgi:hypothetical protein